MGSVSSSLNPGVADLLQTLGNVGSPTLNSKAVVSALESAPPSDIVQLSDEANQLQNIDTLFGIGPPPSSDISNLLASLGGSSTTSSAGNALEQSVLANASPADQLANAQAQTQAVLTQGLFGIGNNTGLPGTLFSTLG
jgi:hypothetical protein